MATKEFNYEKAMEVNGGTVSIGLHVGGDSLRSNKVAVGETIAVRGLAGDATLYFASPSQMQRVAMALLYLAVNTDEETAGYTRLSDMDDWDGTVLEEEPKGWETR